MCGCECDCGCGCCTGGCGEAVEGEVWLGWIGLVLEWYAAKGDQRRDDLEMSEDAQRSH